MKGRVRWTNKAVSDVERLRDFIALHNEEAAQKVVRALVAAPSVLSDFPRLGPRFAGFAPREIRRPIVRRFEVRYEVIGNTVIVLGIWHTSEHR